LPGLRDTEASLDDKGILPPTQTKQRKEKDYRRFITYPEKGDIIIPTQTLQAFYYSPREGGHSNTYPEITGVLLPTLKKATV